jgi:hypothetical protein
MAIFTSELFNNGGLPYRPVEQGSVSSITARVVIPAGTALLSGDVIKFLRLAPGVQVVRAILRNDDLETNASPTLSATGVGFQRTTVDARKAFDATTNPYLSDSIASAVPAALLASGSTNTALRAASNTAINPVVAATTGTVDVAIVLDANAATNPATARNLELTVEFVGPQRTLGEFSGANVYDYQDNSSGI